MAKLRVAGKQKPKSSRVQVALNQYISGKQHEVLVDHLKGKLLFGQPVRDEQADKFEKIDRAVYGYLILDEDDQKRKNDTEKGYGIKPTDVSLPLTLTQMDEAVTYLIEVLGSDTGLYSAMAPKDKQAVATAFSALMNEHATKFRHVRALNKFLFDALKYNFSGLMPEWKKVYGKQIKNNVAGTAPEIDTTLVYQGNELTATDNYNFFYDVSVDPIDLAQKGEFFAQIDVHTKFSVKQMAANEEIFSINDFIDDNSYAVKWYRRKPIIRTDTNTPGDTNWLALLSQGQMIEAQQAIEFATFYIWLNGKDYGLAPKSSDNYQIYRIILANSKHVVHIEELNNAHGMLPVGISMPWEDGFREATKSYAELLTPFNHFASAQMNVHQKAARRALYGVTFFNTNVIPLMDEFDPVAGKMGVNAPPDADLNKAIKQVFDAPDTNNTLNDISAIADLMQKILPTDILKQVAGLERATQYQSAATVQGANRRNLKIARLIDAQCFSQIRSMQMYNILQYQDAMEILTPEGDLIEANPSEFRETKLEFSISEGLRGIDKLSLIINIKEVLNTIVQSQQASQQIDVVGVINYWTSLLGDRTDFSQFKFKSEIDALPPEQKQLAFQLLQAYAQQQQGGEGATNQPATP